MAERHDPRTLPRWRVGALGVGALLMVAGVVGLVAGRSPEPPVVATVFVAGSTVDTELLEVTRTSQPWTDQVLEVLGTADTGLVLVGVAAWIVALWRWPGREGPAEPSP